MKILVKIQILAPFLEHHQHETREGLCREEPCVTATGHPPCQFDVQHNINNKYKVAGLTGRKDLQNCSLGSQIHVKNMYLFKNYGAVRADL